jgi:phage baseplate assembly protein W
VTASSINFKSVGKSTVLVKDELESTQPTIPIGIVTPLRYGNNSLFEMHTNLFDQIKDNLRNLIMTNHGERLVFYDFGANLNELSTERVSREDYDQEVAARIASAVSKWMSYISLDEMIPLDDPDEELGRSRTSTISIRRYLLTYSVPSINSPKQSLEIVVGIT